MEAPVAIMPFTHREVEFDEDRGSEPGGATVLVVDDDRQINDALCDLLTLEGYRVEAAFDGLEAQRKFQPAVHAVVMWRWRMAINTLLSSSTLRCSNR